MKPWKKILWIAALLLLGVGLLSGCARELPSGDDSGLAQTLFLADFKRNYAALYDIVADAAEPEDYAALSAKAAFMKDNLDFMLFSYHCCKIQEDFIPEDMAVVMDDYYEAYRFYLSALAEYLPENTSISPAVQAKLDDLAAALPENVPYQMTIFFDMDEEDAYLLAQQLDEFTAGMAGAAQQMRQETDSTA